MPAVMHTKDGYTLDEPPTSSQDVGSAKMQQLLLIKPSKRSNSSFTPPPRSGLGLFQVKQWHSSS